MLKLRRVFRVSPARCKAFEPIFFHLNSNIMKKFIFPLLLLAVAFAFNSCQQESDLNPNSKQQELTGNDDYSITTRSNAETPFKAEYITTMSFDPANFLPITVNGEGKGIHLGKSKLSLLSWAMAANGDNGYQLGNLTFTAANGDELYARFEGPIEYYPCEPAYFSCGTFVGDYIIGEWYEVGDLNELETWPIIEKDGTGRFAGATGSGTYDGYGNLPFPGSNYPGNGGVVFEGTLINP